MTAKLYVDREHNALGIVEDDPRGIITADHGFDAQDFDRVLGVMERYGGRPAFIRDGVAVWDIDAHRSVVLSSLHEALRSMGYSQDPLDRMSCIDVDDVGAMSYDVTERPARLSEAVERALQNHINNAQAALNEHGDVHAFGITHRERVSTDSYGRRLPLTRVRMQLRRPLSSADQVRAALREALSPVSGALVRASVDEGEGGYDVEIALAPSRTDVTAFNRAKLPAFESHAPILGVRTARITLEEAVPSEALAQLEGRAVACTAATCISRPNSRTLVARIPCSMEEGLSVADNAFQQRLAWLVEQMREWGPDLARIGGIEPIVARNEALAVGARRP